MGSPKQPETIMGQEVLSGLSKEALVKVLPHFLAKAVTSGTESMGLRPANFRLRSPSL